MTDREKLILYRVIGYGATFVGLILFAISQTTSGGNSTLEFFGILFVAGGVVFGIATNRCPYCGGSLGRNPIPHYCPHCGEYIF